MSLYNGNNIDLNDIHRLRQFVLSTQISNSSTGKLRNFLEHCNQDKLLEFVINNRINFETENGIIFIGEVRYLNSDGILFEYNENNKIILFDVNDDNFITYFNNILSVYRNKNYLDYLHELMDYDWFSNPISDDYELENKLKWLNCNIDLLSQNDIKIIGEFSYKNSIGKTLSYKDGVLIDSTSLPNNEVIIIPKETTKQTTKQTLEFTTSSDNIVMKELITASEARKNNINRILIEEIINEENELYNTLIDTILDRINNGFSNLVITNSNNRTFCDIEDINIYNFIHYNVKNIKLYLLGKEYQITHNVTDKDLSNTYMISW
jgi:hypothetical protein